MSHKKKPGTTAVSLCPSTRRLVREWKKAGMNVSGMVRYCMLNTFPIAKTKTEHIRQLRSVKKFKAKIFDEFRREFEEDIARINKRIEEVEAEWKKKKAKKKRQ